MTAESIWDGPRFRAGLVAIGDVLARNGPTLDTMNVFPVPDGDTGTNMNLTARAALAEVQLRIGPTGTVGEIARAYAHGALIGARGNSGVILSQFFRGFADAVTELDRIDGKDFARGLSAASTAAYRAVVKPVEGTMLTVIRIAGEYAEQAALRDPSISAVLRAATVGAEQALAHTPEMLPVLRQAGVVDSGGQGIVLVFQALLATALGASLPTVSNLDTTVPHLDRFETGHDTFGYCINFMISGSGVPFETARRVLAALGQSAVIVGDEQLLKVHIHSERPEEVLEHARTMGTLEQIRVDNMDSQILAHKPWPADASLTPDQIGAVAVASGSGVQEILRSLGACTVVNAEGSMNAVIDDILLAITSVQSELVLILPTSNVANLAAHEAARRATRQVQVLPTKSVPAAMAALAAIRPSGPIAEVLVAVDRALLSVMTIEIAGPVLVKSVGGPSLKPGNWIGRLNEAEAATNTDLGSVIAVIAMKLAGQEFELATVLAGANATEQSKSDLCLALKSHLPDIEVEMLFGGQDDFGFIISLE